VSPLVRHQGGLLRKGKSRRIRRPSPYCFSDISPLGLLHRYVRSSGHEMASGIVFIDFLLFFSSLLAFSWKTSSRFPLFDIHLAVYHP
jgi:hypothetical protein